MKKSTIALSHVAAAVLMALSLNAHAIEPSKVSDNGNDGHAAKNVVDKKLSTRWADEGNDGSERLKFEFAKTVNLKAVNIAFYKGDSRSTYFQIESSENGSDWSVELSATSSGDTKKLETFKLDTIITARYVRIVGLGNSNNKWNSITEVTFTEADIKAPVVTAPVASAPIEISFESSYDNDDHMVDNLFDGDIDTRWSAKGKGQWVRLEFGAEKVLDNVQIAFYKGDDRQNKFSIEVSNDDEEWTTVIAEGKSSGNSKALETFTFDEVKASYIRYTGYGSTKSQWNSLTEFSVTEKGNVITTPVEPIDVDPVEVEPIEPVEVEPIEPVEVEPIEPVEVEPIEPVEVEPIEPVEVEPIEPVEVEPIEPVEVEPIEPVEVEPIEPVEAEPVTGETHYTSADNLNSALAKAAGGDEIIITDSGEISIKNISFDKPVLIRAEKVGGLKLENATISNSNNITLQGFLFGPSNDVSTLVKIVNSTNIKISRNYFDHLDVTEGQSSLVVTESSQYIEIDHNEFHDKNISVVNGEKNTGSYIKFQYDDGKMTKNAHIHHNYFNNITPYLVDGIPAGDSDREAIVMGISSSQDIVTNNVVEYNLFENCDGENEILTIKTSENTFRYNTFKNSMGSLSFRLGHDNQAYGNYFYGTGASESVTDDNYQTGGIRVYGAGHSVYDNYMKGLSGTSWRLPLLVDNGDTSDSSNGDNHQTPTDITIANNTIVDSIGGGIYIGREDSKYKNKPTGISITGNVVVGTEGTLFNNHSGGNANTWSNNTAYATSAAMANGGTILSESELEVMSKAPSSPELNTLSGTATPTPLTPRDVGISAK